jgi:hypothetical protein
MGLNVSTYRSAPQHKGFEGKTRLAASAGSRDDDKLPKGQVKVYTAEIILTRATDAYDRGHRPLYDGNSSRRAVFLHIFELLGAKGRCHVICRT